MAEESCRDDGKEAELELPGGIKARAKGYRMGDLVNFGVFLLLIGIGYLVWEHKSDAQASQKIVAATIEKTSAETTSAFKDVAASQRLFACIIAQPQEVRLAEFSSDNSFCARMSKLR